MQYGQEGVTNLSGGEEEKDELVLKGSSAFSNKNEEKNNWNIWLHLLSKKMTCLKEEK